MSPKLLKGLFLATTLLGSSLIASQAAADNLEDVVRQALTTNPKMSVFLSNRESIDFELRRERGLYLPQIDIAAGIGYQQYDSQSSQLRGTDDDWLDREEYSVALTQRLFDGFEAASKIGKQKARVESASRRVFENAEVLALDAINAFLEVRRQRELVRLSEENLQAHEDMLANLREREASDAGSSVDVVQTEARRSLARATLFRVQNQLRDSEANYKRIVGEHPTDLDEPTVDVSALPQDWEDALTLAKESNPTTKIFEAEINIAKKDVEIADSNMYPKINLEAEYSKLQDADGDEEEIDSAMLMVRMRWNLYRGGSDQAEKRAALARVMQAKNSRYDAANGAVEEMRISWNSYEITAERVKVLGEAVEFNQETLNNYKELFNVGQRSLLDVLDAENELFVSRSLLVTANSNHMSASYRMLAAGGQLLDTLNIEPPKQGNPETPTFTQQVFSD